ncbi:hypothetical protein BSL82_00525 [Tardibacter chloracetimidivorans]|uniref:Uncharacterized protein n=1 Tax=Tardibacter chloracetimidivorans TaxID=1921510 RepID=A0A1L3ZQT0_9SPHN|nr:hypothetical protein [Tardibacter chloracetimidivorans]API57973.1 hypothetical protein BSL82_00525 [Tardibacter chloracetimidivorans]
MKPIVLYRWIAEITYRRDAEDECRVVSFEELHELHDIIEDGPDFYAIKDIIVRPSGRCAPTTIEASERA